MRILSYNILDGGEGRADPLAEVIEAQRADVVALIEADHPEVLERIAKRLRTDMVVARGPEHAVALLSRWPIVESLNHSAGGPLAGTAERPRCLLEALVRDPATGAEWPVGIVHGHPRAGEADEEVREREVRGLLEVFERHRMAGRPHVLAGDFNADSPVQEIDPERCKESTREAWRRNGGTIPRRAVQLLLDAGYVDTLHAAHPESAGKTGSFTTQQPGQRVDYIFAFGLAAAQIRAAWVEQDRLAKYASDHFPVGAELAL